MTISTQRRRHGTKKIPLATKSLTQVPKQMRKQTQSPETLGSNEHREQTYTGTCHGECHFTTDSSQRASTHTQCGGGLRAQPQELQTRGSSSSQHSLHGSDVRAQTQELQLVVAVMPTYTRVHVPRTHAYTDAHCYHQRHLCFTEKRAYTYKHRDIQATMFIRVSYALQKRARPLLHTNARTRRRLCEAADTYVRTHSNGMFRTGRHACMS